MSDWGNKPWENDGAGDWFEKVMRQANMRKHIMNTIREEIDPFVNTTIMRKRAAIATFIMLSRTYSWGDEDGEYFKDLATVLETAKHLYEDQNMRNWQTKGQLNLLEKEIAELESRLPENRKRGIQNEDDTYW